jgi:hypothetical protein
MMKRAWIPAAAWLAGVTLLYFISHKPLTPALAVALFTDIWRLIAVMLLVTVAGGLGFWLLPAEEHPVLTRLALQAGLGLGILSTGFLLLDATLGLPTWLLWILPLALLALLRRKAWAWLRQWQALGAAWKDTHGFARAAAVLLGALAFCALLVALAPPLKYDAQMYHLAMPAEYLRQGRVSYLPEIVMSGMPQNGEMLFTWAIALGGLPAGPLMGWIIGLLALLGLLGQLSSRWGGDAAWAGTAALLAGYTPAALLGWGYVDWVALLFGLAAWVYLEAWGESQQRRDVLLAGLFTGLAVGAKYTSGVLALAGVAALAWLAWRKKSAFIPAVFAYGLPALAIALPWFVKNALSTGNPFYPFFFSAGAMTPLRLQVYQSLPAWGNWADFFVLPLRATLVGVEAGDGYMFSAGPLLLGLGALAWLGRRRHTSLQQAHLRTAAALAISGLLLWAVGNRFSGNLIQTRYYFTLFPAFAALAAAGYWGLEQHSRPPVRAGLLARTFILLVLSLNLLEIGMEVIRSGAPQVILGLKDEQAYLADNLGWFQPAMQTVRQLPAGSRALMLYEPRGLYCAPQCVPDDLLDRWKRSLAEQGSPQNILAAWKSQGFTHLLVYTAGVEFMRTANDPHHPLSDIQALDAFLAQLPEPQRFGSAYSLYTLP